MICALLVDCNIHGLSGLGDTDLNFFSLHGVTPVGGTKFESANIPNDINVIIQCLTKFVFQPAPSSC